MCKFTSDEIQVLVDALDAWEKQASTTSTLTMMLTTAFVKDKDEAKAMIDDDAAKAKAETKSRERRAILLKAKLIQMQDELTEMQLFKVGTPDSTATQGE